MNKSGKQHIRARNSNGIAGGSKSQERGGGRGRTESWHKGNRGIGDWGIMEYKCEASTCSRSSFSLGSARKRFYPTSSVPLILNRVVDTGNAERDQEAFRDICSVLERWVKFGRFDEWPRPTFEFQEFLFVFMSSPRSHDHADRISEIYSEYETIKSVALGMKRREERRGVAEEVSIWGV